MTTRDINELYDMTSYQDMTDEEIDLLIDFKIKLAITTALADYSSSTERAAYDTLMTKILNLIDSNNQAFNLLLNTTPELEVISLE